MEIKLSSVDCENKKWSDASAFATCENGYWRRRDEFHLLVAEMDAKIPPRRWRPRVSARRCGAVWVPAAQGPMH